MCWKYRKDVEPMVVEDIVDVDNKMCCEPVVLPYLNEMAREQWHRTRRGFYIAINLREWINEDWNEVKKAKGTSAGATRELVD